MMGFMTGTIFANRKLSTGRMGRLVQAVFVTPDITKQRKAEKAEDELKETLRKFQVFFHSQLRYYVIY